ncbi:hypothetical protein [Chryseobacterium indoltheticum]|uniref:hypothetical protein n=1 Tax=Chryseobacterium indoltheticum TaxID=254 RepID=UPI003F4982F3
MKLVPLSLMEDYNLQPRFKDSPHFKDFWTKGNGKQLIDFSGAELSFKDFEKFAPFFYHVDELGDEVVKDVYFTKKYTEASREIEQYIRNGVSENDEVPKV